MGSEVEYRHLIREADLEDLIRILNSIPPPRKENLHPKQTAAANWLGITPRTLTYQKQVLSGRT